MADQLTLEVGNPAHGGYCIARIGEDAGPDRAGKVALVLGALAGERVRAEVLEERPKHLVARVTEVLIPSPYRVAHVWPLAAREDVGGADLGHVAQAAQLRWKEQVIEDSLTRIGGPAVVEAIRAVAPEGVRVTSAPGGTLGWRTRASFVAAPRGHFAMRRSRSHELVELESMPLAVPEIAELELFSGAWHLTPGEEVRAVMPSGSRPVLVTPSGTWASPNQPIEPAITEVVKWAGRDFQYQLSAAGFWQSHRAAPEVLVDAVMRASQAEPGQRVLELYSGAGLFTVPLATAVGPRGAVIALEGSAAAVEDARVNVRGLPAARVERARVDGRKIAGIGGHFDLVVLDPPRAGAGIAVTDALKKLAPARIVYVACDPAALARDLKSLVTNYEVDSIAGFDLFPSTHHIEVVAALARRPQEVNDHKMDTRSPKKVS